MTGDEIHNKMLLVYEGIYASEPDVKWTEKNKAECRKDARQALQELIKELERLRRIVHPSRA
jgi:hypothetical protein